MERRPVVSGTFYPEEKGTLKMTIENLQEKETTKQEALAVIAPHAGYIYSGKLACQVYSRLIPKKRVILLGPNHTGRGSPFGIWPEGKWLTPLGEIEVEKTLVDKLTRNSHLRKDSLSHLYEHSLEVQLPFLQYFFKLKESKDFTIVPISCSWAEPEICQEIALKIFETLKEEEDFKETLIVASSDMNHYESSQITTSKDRKALEAILEVNPRQFLERTKKEEISVCGVVPIYITLHLLKMMGIKRGELIDYYTSGDINRDYTSVVGYAGVLFSLNP